MTPARSRSFLVPTPLGVTSNCPHSKRLPARRAGMRDGAAWLPCSRTARGPSGARPGAGCSCEVAASRGCRRHDLSARDGVRADADPMALGAGRPRLKSESVDSPQLAGVGDLLADADNDHAPSDMPRGIDAIDLKRCRCRAQEGVKLRSQPRPKQHALGGLIKDVVDGSNQGMVPSGNVDNHPPEARCREQTQTFWARELKHLARATSRLF